MIDPVASPTAESAAPETPADSTPASEPTEAPATSTEGEQSAAPATEEPTAPKWSAAEIRRLRKEDPDFDALWTGEHKAAVKKALAREQARETKRLAAEAIADPDDTSAGQRAFDVAQRIAAQPDEDDEEQSSAVTGHRNATALTQDVDFFQGPEYGAVFKADRDTLNKQFNKLAYPEFKAWVRTEGRRLDREAITAEVKADLMKQIPTLAEAQATELVNQALQNSPVLPGGGGSAGSKRTYTAQEVRDMSIEDFERNIKTIQAQVL